MIGRDIFHVATPQDGLSAEMALLDAVAKERAGPSAFFWAARERGLVLPDRFTRAEGFDAAARALAAKGWPVVPRSTGGGITPQGPGVLNLAIAFKRPEGQSRTIKASYAELCEPMTEGFATLGITAEATPVKGSFCDGDYNLAIAGRKIVGTAQRWRGTTCLCHALILTDLELAPAVAAVAALSEGLGHDTVFDLSVHTRLADHVSGAALDEAAASAIWPALAKRGYTPWDMA